MHTNGAVVLQQDSVVVEVIMMTQLEALYLSLCSHRTRLEVTQEIKVGKFLRFFASQLEMLTLIAVKLIEGLSLNES